MKKGIILDRDGVINKERGEYTYLESDFVLNEDIAEVLQELTKRGYVLVIISNQSGIAKGIYSHNEVLNLHNVTIQKLSESEICFQELYYCPHHPDYSGNCLCRKPGSLLYEKAMARFELDPRKSYVIGDKDRDIEPGKLLGFNVFKIEPNQSLKKILSLID